MARQHITNPYDPAELREGVLELRREGWKVKFVYDSKTSQPGVVNGSLQRFRANKGHVNLRGGDGYHNIGDWDTGIRIAGWIFKIFVRNENGGYVLKHALPSYDEAVVKANEEVAQEAPVIPTWDRKDLPEPFPLPDRTGYPMTKGETYMHDEKYRRIKCECVKFECLTTLVSSLGIVSISPDCKVTMDAAAVPGNRAWFLLQCSGTTGKLLLVTDGEYFYPISKRGKKYKISLTLETKRANFGNLTYRDSDRLRAAVEVFANTIAEQHSAHGQG